MKPYLSSIKEKIGGVLLMLPWLTAMPYFMLAYPFSFNYETNIVGQYELVYVLPLLLLILCVYIFKKEASLMHHQLLIAGAIFLLLLILFSKYYSFGNEHFFVCASLYFLLAGFLLWPRIGSANIFIIAWSIMLFYQLYLGIDQYWEAAIYNTNNISLAIKGSLQNSGIYACYLVISIPFVYYTVCKLPAKLNNSKFGKTISVLSRIFFVLILLLIAGLIIITQSRTAYIATVAVSLSYLLHRYGSSIQIFLKRLPKIITALIILLGISIATYGAYYLFFLKKMSAMGRMMKLQITWQHIGDHFWWGTGLGRFTWYYPQWQAQYFADKPQPPKNFFLSAGESYIIFNEYLQLFKELGFVGFIVVVILLVYFFKTRSEKYKQLLLADKLTVITLLACGFTSYPLHVTAFMLVGVFCIATTLATRIAQAKPLQLTLLYKLFVAATIVLTVFPTNKAYHTHKAVLQWQQQANTYTAMDAKEIYKGVYTTLQNDGKFLTDYGLLLAQDSATSKAAIPVLEEAKTVFISRPGIENLTKAYAMQKQYNAAIQNIQWLCHYLPGKFATKYELLKLYDTKGDVSNALQMAKSILRMPVKINSPEVEQIKTAAKTYVQNKKLQ